MNINLSLIGRTAVVILWIVVITVLLTGRNNHNPPAATRSKTISTEKTSTSPETTSTAVKRPASKYHTAPSPKDENLANRVQDFMDAYYIIRPQDTSLTRRQRVAPYVAKEALPLLDLSLSSGTKADNARIANRLTLSGKAVMPQLSNGRSAEGRSFELVNVPVVITVKSRSGHRIRSFTIHTASLWRLTGGRWLLVNFDKGGSDAG